MVNIAAEVKLRKVILNLGMVDHGLAQSIKVVHCLCGLHRLVRVVHCLRGSEHSIVYVGYSTVTVADLLKRKVHSLSGKSINSHTKRKILDSIGLSVLQSHTDREFSCSFFVVRWIL